MHLLENKKVAKNCEQQCSTETATRNKKFNVDSIRAIVDKKQAKY